MKRHCIILFCAAFMLCGLPVTAQPSINTQATPATRLNSLRVKDLTLRELAELLTRGCEIPVIVSADCADIPVHVYLQNVNAMDALKTICRSQGLWMTTSPEGVVMITTLQQHLASEAVYSESYMESLTVKYPSVNDVGDTLKGLFRDRIVWERIDGDENDPIEDIERALDRMDQLSDRGQFDIGSTQSSSDDSSNDNNSSNYNSSNDDSSDDNDSSNNSSGCTEGEALKQLQSLQEREDYMRSQMAAHTGIKNIIKQGPALIYLSALPEINTLLVRSSDRAAVQLVKKAVEAMDKPRGQVLLQVNVLSVTLDDSVETGVEWLFEDVGSDHVTSSGFADSAINKLIDETTTTSGVLGTARSEYISGTPIVSYLNNSVRARITALAEHKNTRMLAKPTLLVADNEAAHVFVGTEGKYVDEITPGITSNTDGGITTTDTTVTLEDRSIGFSLLITPRIHADRTVTLRLMHERSELAATPRNINASDTYTVEVQDIDQEVVTSTLVASDNSLIVLGGMISETEIETDSGIPLLKDLPLLGRLFSSKGDQTVREELMVLIRPHVIAVPGESEAASLEVLQDLGLDPNLSMNKGEQK